MVLRRVPLLPVNLATYVPLGVAPVDVTVRLDVPIEPEVTGTILGLRETERPGTTGTDAFKLTTPAKP